MGQYHTIYNKTKNEYFSIGGAKLLEKSFNPACSTALMVLLCNSNGRGGGDLYVRQSYTKNLKPIPLKGRNKEIQDAVEEMQGRWAGDSIVIQGDYAQDSDPSFVDSKTLDSAVDITGYLLIALRADPELNETLDSEEQFLKSIRKWGAS